MHFLFFEAYFLVTVVYAALRGGAAERVTAALFTLAYILSLAQHAAHMNQFATVNVGLLLVDLALFVALYILSLFTTRFWPLWMCAMQGVDVLGHLVPLTEPGPGYGYAVMVQFWGYPMQALLIVATWRHRRRLALYGMDPAWISLHRAG
jgi:hypothetical protein